MKYKINVEDVETEIEADTLEEARAYVLENTSIIEGSCTCGGCEVCIHGEEAFNEANGLNN